jgi:hypothetical protein
MYVIIYHLRAPLIDHTTAVQDTFFQITVSIFQIIHAADIIDNSSVKSYLFISINVSMTSILEKLKAVTAGSNRKILHRINGTSLHQKNGVLRPSSMLRTCNLRWGAENDQAEFGIDGCDGVDDDDFRNESDAGDQGQQNGDNQLETSSDAEDHQYNSDNDHMNCDDEDNDAEDERRPVSLQDMWEDTTVPAGAGKAPIFSSLKNRILEIVYPRVEVLVSLLDSFMMEPGPNVFTFIKIGN